MSDNLTTTNESNGGHFTDYPPFLLRKQFLREHVFSMIENKIVLEVGCFDGYLSVVIAEHNPELIILLESDQVSVDAASTKLGITSHLAIHGDMHLDLNRAGKVDVALLLGVIYHSPAPLHLLEQLVNHCDPEKVFIDNPGNSLEYVDEPINIPGNRYTIGGYKSCGITTRLDDYNLIKAMNNLGYKLDWIKHYPEGSMNSHAPVFSFTKQ